MKCDFCHETHQTPAPCDAEREHAVELYTRAHTEILSKWDFRWLGEYEDRMARVNNSINGTPNAIKVR